MSSNKPLLVYWDIRGLAEPIRLLLRYLKVDFEDRRIPMGELFPDMMEPLLRQKNTHVLDFPNLPYYIDESVKITQSLAIIQHIGRKYNLAGDTLEDKAVLDMLTQTINDLRWGAWVTYNSPNFNEFESDWKKTTSIPARLREMNVFLEGKEFILGRKISYVDFLLYEHMEWYRQFAMDLFETAPELKNIQAFQKRIEALPQIKAYLELDNFKYRPFFAPVVNFGYSKDPSFRAMPLSYRNLSSKYPLESVIVKNEKGDKSGPCKIQ